MNGIVKAICICPIAGEPMQHLLEVQAFAGRGLEGDRYAKGEGSFNKGRPGIRQVTLMNTMFFEDSGFEFRDTRRNLFVQDVEMMGLIGRDFKIGTAHFHGVKYCDPCSRIDKLTGNPRNFRQTFFDRGGIIAVITKSGVINVGDLLIPPPRTYD